MTRLSVIFLYHRIFGVYRGFTGVLWLNGTCTILWVLCGLLLCTFRCKPVSAFWDPTGRTVKMLLEIVPQLRALPTPEWLEGSKELSYQLRHPQCHFRDIECDTGSGSSVDASLQTLHATVVQRCQISASGSLSPWWLVRSPIYVNFNYPDITERDIDVS
jgi:hypothetical protein